MNIGYACLTVGVPYTNIKGCTLKNANAENLESLIAHNLRSLENIIDYNIRNDIMLFRISSDIIPFGSSKVNTVAWNNLFDSKLSAIAKKIQAGRIRVSMHPGQYTVLNSSDSQVVSRAIDDLQYHADFLDSLNTNCTNKIVLHIGGVYGDKKLAIERFAKHFAYLSDSIKQRLVIENDDKCYTIDDVLEIGNRYKIPVVYDNLHNCVNCCDPTKSDEYWIAECAKTWDGRDGNPKIHYSQQDQSKKAGSHSASISINEFLHFYQRLGESKPDIMLEVKDKNLSAIKCLNCLAQSKNPNALKAEWGRYQYAILERSPADYNKISSLLNDKELCPIYFYNVIQASLNYLPSKDNEINAALQIWDSLNHLVEEREKRAFLKTIKAYSEGVKPLSSIKNALWKMAEKQNLEQLLTSYYFID